MFLDASASHINIPNYEKEIGFLLTSLSLPLYTEALPDYHYSYAPVYGTAHNYNESFGKSPSLLGLRSV